MTESGNGGPIMQERRLNLGLAIALVAGNMIGSGIYLLPASIASIGSSSLIAWLLTLGGALLFGGVFSLLALHLTSGDAGLLDQVREMLGLPAGFVSAAVYWVNCVVGNIAIALAVTGYLGALLPPLAASSARTALTTIAILWVIIGINLLGPRLVARFEAWTLAVGLLPIAAVALIGWGSFDADLFAAAWNPSGEPIAAGLPNAVLTLFWAFLGLETVGIVAALVDRPERNVPLATFGGILLAGAIYIAACSAMFGIIPVDRLRESTAPFADTTAIMFGGATGALIALCAALKAAGTLAGWVLLTARTLPGSSGLGRHSPRRVMLASGVLMTGMVVATSSPTIAEQFTILTNAAVVLTLIVYSAACLALIVADRRPWARLLALAAIGFAAWIVILSGKTLLLWSLAVVTAPMLVLLVRRLRTGVQA